MNLVAVIGSPRKGKATDTLVDKAIEGAISKNPSYRVKKLNLVDYDIQYCRNCLVCRDAKTDEPISKCVIKDGMSQIYEVLLEFDALIFGTPVHSGYPTALMMAVLRNFGRYAKEVPCTKPFSATGQTESQPAPIYCGCRNFHSGYSG